MAHTKLAKPEQVLETLKTGTPVILPIEWNDKNKVQQVFCVSPIADFYKAKPYAPAHPQVVNLVSEKELYTYLQELGFDIQKEIFENFKQTPTVWVFNQDTYIIWSEKTKLSPKYAVSGFAIFEPLPPEADITTYNNPEPSKLQLNLVNLDTLTVVVNNPSGELIEHFVDKVPTDLFSKRKEEQTETLIVNYLKNLLEVFDTKLPELAKIKQTYQAKFDAIQTDGLSFNELQAKEVLLSATETPNAVKDLANILAPNESRKIVARTYGETLFNSDDFVEYLQLTSDNSGQVTPDTIKNFVTSWKTKTQDELNQHEKILSNIINDLSTYSTFDAASLKVEEVPPVKKSIKQKNYEYLASAVFYLVIPMKEDMAKPTDGYSSELYQLNNYTSKYPYREIFSTHKKDNKEIKGTLLTNFWRIIFSPMDDENEYLSDFQKSSYVKQIDSSEGENQKELWPTLASPSSSSLFENSNVIWNNGEASPENLHCVNLLCDKFRKILHRDSVQNLELLEQEQRQQEMLASAIDEDYMEDFNSVIKTHSHVIFLEPNTYGFNAIRTEIKKNFPQQMHDLDALFGLPPPDMKTLHSQITEKQFYNLEDFYSSVMNFNPGSLNKHGIQAFSYYKSELGSKNIFQVKIENNDDFQKLAIIAFMRMLNIWNEMEVDIEEVFKKYQI